MKGVARELLKTFLNQKSYFSSLCYTQGIHVFPKKWPALAHIYFQKNLKKKLLEQTFLKLYFEKTNIFYRIDDSIERTFY